MNIEELERWLSDLIWLCEAKSREQALDEKDKAYWRGAKEFAETTMKKVKEIKQ